MAFEVSPILWPMIFAPALTFSWVTSPAMAYESSMTMSGNCFDSWRTGFLVRSASSSIWAHFIRSALDIMGKILQGKGKLGPGDALDPTYEIQAGKAGF